MEERTYEIDIPPYFLCPISMQLMNDPVIVSSGITYDRENIEKWLFSFNNTTCPVTKQRISISDLTPNHTLRRLLQDWCTLNPHATKSGINGLNRLRPIAYRDESSRNQLQVSGAAAIDFFTSIVRRNDVEALDILQNMELMHVFETGNYKSRAHAIALLKSALTLAGPGHLIGSKPELFQHVTRVVADRISPQATKSALKVLVELCPWGRNRVKAVEGGAVSVLIELLLETAERRVCELVLTILDQLCGCAEGRAEFLRHGAGLAVVSKKIYRVSLAASERAVRIICSISRHSTNARVLEEMVEVGVVTKLCLVVQVGGSEKMKERAKEILRLHSRVWKGSSCIPSQLATSYPS